MSDDTVTPTATTLELGTLSLSVLESEETLTKLQAFLRAHGVSHSDLAKAVEYQTQTIGLAACGKRCGPALARAISLSFEGKISYEDVKDSQRYVWAVSRTMLRLALDE